MYKISAYLFSVCIFPLFLFHPLLPPSSPPPPLPSCPPVSCVPLFSSAPTLLKFKFSRRVFWRDQYTLSEDALSVCRK